MPDGAECASKRRGFEWRPAIETATILLIRHAEHEQVGKILSGRSEGLDLTGEGANQARRLASRLSAQPPDVIQTSPLIRARQTAKAISEACSRDVQTVDALNEVDFGDWTGRAFADLEHDPAWRFWNERRSVARAPDGESMAEARDRALGHFRGAAARHAGRLVAMVTHCDIIRALVASILGLSLDRILRFDIDTASVSRMASGPWGSRVVSVNEVEA